MFVDIKLNILTRMFYLAFFLLEPTKRLVDRKNFFFSFWPLFDKEFRSGISENQKFKWKRANLYITKYIAHPINYRYFRLPLKTNK